MARRIKGSWVKAKSDLMEDNDGPRMGRVYRISQNFRDLNISRIAAKTGIRSVCK